MDEAAVAAQVALNVPKETPEPASTPSTIQPDTPTDTGYVDNMPFDELTKYKLCEQFQITNAQQSDPQTLEKLGLVYSWAATQAGSDDWLAVVGYLSQAEGVMGYGSLQSKLDKFYQFAKLDLQRRRIEKEMVYAS